MRSPRQRAWSFFGPFIVLAAIVAVFAFVKGLVALGLVMLVLGGICVVGLRSRLTRGM
jgi:hypothetical protein